MFYIETFYDILLLLISIAGFARYKKLTTPFKLLTIGVFVTLILAICAYLSAIWYKTNAAVLQLECISTFVFFAAIYYFLFINKIVRKVIIVLVVAIIIFFTINACFIQPFNKQFPSNVNLVSLILFTISSLMLFKQMLQYPLTINITRQSIFWYNVAMLFYSTTMFLNLGLANYYGEHNLNDFSIYYFWYGILYVFHILIGVSILTDNKEVIASYAE